MKKLGKLALRLYRGLLRPEEMEDQRLRMMYKSLYGIDVGLYSYGCFDYRRFQAGLTVGRYCSFAWTSRRLNGNHGMQYLTMHPYAYNTGLGIVKEETILRTTCVVEDDVWVGHNAIILPSVQKIGRGAVIAAGAVVSHDVPAYAIVAGVPAKVLKFRFTESQIEKVEASQWWQLDKEGIRQLIEKNPDLVFDPITHLDGGSLI